MGIAIGKPWLDGKADSSGRRLGPLVWVGTPTRAQVSSDRWLIFVTGRCTLVKASSHVAKSGAGGGDVEIEHSFPDLLPPEFALADLEGATEVDASVTDGRVAAGSGRGATWPRPSWHCCERAIRSQPPGRWPSAPACRCGWSSTISPRWTTCITTWLRCSSGDSGPRCPASRPSSALATRVERTVAHRAVLYEEISPVRRALVRRMSTSDGVSAAIQAADTLLLESLKETFEPSSRRCREQPDGSARGHRRGVLLGGMGEAPHGLHAPGARGEAGDDPHARRRVRQPGERPTWGAPRRGGCRFLRLTTDARR